MKKLNLILVFLLVAASFSCSKKNETPFNIQGEWEEIADPIGSEAGQSYKFKFGCGNKFSMEISSFTDAARPDLDSCSQFTWVEYVSGTYEQQGNSLKLSGIYTDSLYQPINRSCHNTGNVNWELEIIKGTSQLTLKENQNFPYYDLGGEIKLKKIKDISCSGGVK